MPGVAGQNPNNGFVSSSGGGATVFMVLGIGIGILGVVRMVLSGMAKKK